MYILSSEFRSFQLEIEGAFAIIAFQHTELVSIHVERKQMLFLIAFNKDSAIEDILVRKSDDRENVLHHPVPGKRAAGDGSIFLKPLVLAKLTQQDKGRKLRFFASCEILFLFLREALDGKRLMCERKITCYVKGIQVDVQVCGTITASLKINGIVFQKMLNIMVLTAAKPFNGSRQFSGSH